MLLVPWLLALPGAPVHARDVPGAARPTILAGELHEIRLDFHDPELARELLSVVEASWAETCGFLGRTGPAPRERLAIHVYGTIEAYEAVEAARTGGRFAKNHYFSHFETRSVHGVLAPDGSPSVRGALGTSQHFLRQIGHEAAHVAVYTLVPNHRSHPDWLAEGVATHVEERLLVARGWTTEAEETPFFATRMRNCQTLRARGLLPDPRAIFQEELAHLGWQERYAVWWAFFRFLVAHHEPKLRELLDVAWGLGGGGDYAQRLYARIRTLWDDAALDRLAAGFRGNVDAFRPRWFEDYRSLECAGATWRQLAYAAHNAIAWRLEEEEGPYVLGGRVGIPASENPQANVLLAKDEAGFFSLALRVGAGATLLEYRRDGDAWIRHWHVERVFLHEDPIGFRVAVSGREIVVHVDGALVGRHTAARDLSGRWGVGVQASGGALWQGVQATR